MKDVLVTDGHRIAGCLLANVSLFNLTPNYRSEKSELGVGKSDQEGPSGPSELRMTGAGESRAGRQIWAQNQALGLQDSQGGPQRFTPISEREWHP